MGAFWAKLSQQQRRGKKRKKKEGIHTFKKILSESRNSAHVQFSTPLLHDYSCCYLVDFSYTHGLSKYKYIYIFVLCVLCIFC